MLSYGARAEKKTQEEGGKQDEIHLPGLRRERMAEARDRAHLRRLHGTDEGRGRRGLATLTDVMGMVGCELAVWLTWRCWMGNLWRT